MINKNKIDQINSDLKFWKTVLNICLSEKNSNFRNIYKEAIKRCEHEKDLLILEERYIKN